MPLGLHRTSASVNPATVESRNRCVTTMTSRIKIFVNTITQFVKIRRNPESSTLAAVNVSRVQFCSLARPIVAIKGDTSRTTHLEKKMAIFFKLVGRNRS